MGLRREKRGEDGFVWPFHLAFSLSLLFSGLISYPLCSNLSLHYLDSFFFNNPLECDIKMNGLLNWQNLSSPSNDSWTRTWKLYVIFVLFCVHFYFILFFTFLFLDCSFIQWGLCVMVYLPFVIVYDADHASVPPSTFLLVLHLLQSGACFWMQVVTDSIAVIG